MKSQGWHRQVFFILGMVGALTCTSVFASSLTIREIKLLGNSDVEIQFDSPISKKMLEFDFVRDIAQLSITNSTIYPAKILHAEKQTFNKVFAYQYAPSLVRVRFSVEGAAGQFQGKVETQINGNRLTVKFPRGAVAVVETAKVSQEDNEASEKALLAKIEKAEKNEKSDKAERAERSAEKSEKASSDKTLTTKKGNTALGGVKPGPSVLKSMLAMLLIVGGLGAVLIWVKRKKNSQATRVGNNWFSNFLPQGMRKQKSFIEIVGQHALGPKQSITVVKIRGQQFVLGVTQDSVQLITQIDADETEVDLLEDPAVAASLGKMFGSAPQKTSASEKKSLGDTFANLLKATTGNAPANRTGAGAVTKPQAAGATAAIGRQQYAQQNTVPATPAVTRAAVSPVNPNSGIRDQIRKRLEGARS